MVFFTCNHCGDSLQKPKVEKHYQWKKCSGAVPFLTCVDCLKDFKDDEYKLHTKCITEDEKYSAKGYVAKPEKNKGAEKQESWTETLRSLIDKPNLDVRNKQIIERIANQNNVPRKKQKFINFVKNSLKISMDNALKIWEIIEDALEEFKKANEAKRTEKQTKNLPNDATTNKDISIETTKKQKKKKENGNNEIDEKMNNGKRKFNSKVEEMNGNDGEQVVKKSKKKMKLNQPDTTMETDDNVSTTNGTTKNGENKTNFNWSQVILKILSKKKSIAVDQLKTKVLKKYCSLTSKSITSKVEKKFFKNLKCLDNVSVDGDIVRLTK